MVWVPGGKWADVIDFIGWLGPYELPPYYMDRLEVTNREFQEFIEQGGYRKREYWNYKFRRNGHELSWAEAMTLFHDRTGRSGPSTWEGGHFPAGQADYRFRVSAGMRPRHLPTSLARACLLFRNGSVG